MQSDLSGMVSPPEPFVTRLPDDFIATKQILMTQNEI